MTLIKLDKFGFCASNVFTNYVEDPGAQFSLAGYSVVDWDAIYPEVSEFVVPGPCEDTKEYLPGQKAIKTWDYTEIWLGYPSFSITWAALGDIDVQKVYQEYDKAFNQCQGRVWLTYFRMENATWEYTSGVMEEPKVQSFVGGAALNLTLKFGRLGFHLNPITNDHPAGPGLNYNLGITNSGFNTIYNDYKFRPSGWNY